MLDKELSRSMLLLVNDKLAYDLLNRYVGVRIELHRKSLETATDIDTIRRLQGSINELRRFSTLREEVIQGAK